MRTFKEIRKTLNEKVYRPPGRTSTLGGIILQGFKKHIERSKMSKIDEKKLTKMWGDWCRRKGYSAALDYILDMQKKAKLDEGTFLLFGMKGHKFGQWVKEEDLSMESQDYYRMKGDFVIMIQGTEDQGELKAMMRALKGSYRSKAIGVLDSMKGGRVKYDNRLPVLEIRDIFDLIIDEK